MSRAFRLAHGGRIDRTRPLRFRFNGRRLEGYAGDTLASALLANGIHLVARSVKYHRPRGIFAAGAEEPNALVQLEAGGRSEPDTRATQLELYDGIVASSGNAWPGVRFDILGFAGLLPRLLGPGFYYKTFMAPRALWLRLYEPLLRRLGGLGVAPTEPDPDRYGKMHHHCDVLVVGAGPAGLAAALAASMDGARVTLIDEQSEPGGSLLALRAGEIDGLTPASWVESAVAQLRARHEVTLLSRTTAIGYYDHNYLLAVQHLPHSGARGHTRQRLWKIRARQVILATGAHERPLLFANNDRPAVMLAGAVRTYLNRYAVVPGQRAVVFANNDSAYPLAAELLDQGVEVAAIIDARSPAGRVPAQKIARHARILAGHVVLDTRGVRRISAVEVARSDGTGKLERIGCDVLAVSGGWNPVAHLFSQARGRLAYDARNACLVPASPGQPGCRIVGSANATWATGDCIAEGTAAGQSACADAAGKGASIPVSRASMPQTRPLPAPLLARLEDRASRVFVDLQTDATMADIRQAVAEGLASVEHVKRYTAIGMGTDQGKTSNLNALGVLASVTGRELSELGHTTFRPPYTPVSFGALAGRERGRLFDPERRTPMHEWHRAAGAVLEDVGQWKRPRYYLRSGEDMQAAVARECRAVRRGVGIFDSSTLGKIELSGREAAEFLERMYTNEWKSLRVGACRYGLMCRQDGTVFDDGVTTRLAENRYLMSTTTGNAAAVMEWLEEWLQTEWPRLEVLCTSVTEQWASITLSGPHARQLLEAAAPAIDCSARAFPFMTMREGDVAGHAARLFRISFTGELTYEINVPWSQGHTVWTALIELGSEHGLTPYGTEALHVLRAEKGYIAIGHETDVMTTPEDLGLGWAVSATKPFFVGQRSLARSDALRKDRHQLVGLLAEPKNTELAEGAQLYAAADRERRQPIGHVTSSYFSACLERRIALALVEGGRGRIGETLSTAGVDRATHLRIVEPVFYDPRNERRNG